MLVVVQLIKIPKLTNINKTIEILAEVWRFREKQEFIKYLI